jgi:hypothetical protein
MIEKAPEQTFFEQGNKLERLIASMEQSPFLNDGDRINLELVFDGIKPGTFIHFMYLPEDPEYHGQGISNEEELQKAVRNFSQLLDNAGLRYDLKIKDSFNQVPIREAEFCVSKDKTTAELLARAHAEKDDREFGRLVGYPPTAVNAFVDNEPRIEREDLPEDIRNSEYINFQNFVLSKKHWREETETIKKWAETIKRMDPVLYERDIAHNKKPA